VVTTFIVQNLLGLISLVATLVGLLYAVMAWRAAKRAAAAATKAEAAAHSARDGLRRLDTLAAITEAIAILEEIQRHHRTQAWPTLLERYSAAKGRLGAIRCTNSKYLESRAATISNTQAHLTTFQSQVESFSANGARPPALARWNNILNQEIDMLRETQSGFLDELGVEAGP
jgi:hypothetical protein